MASPLLRHVFADYRKLRSRGSKPVNQSLKAPGLDPDSTMADAEEPMPLKLRLRSNKLAPPVNDHSSESSKAKSLSRHSVETNISAQEKPKPKPLPPLPTKPWSRAMSSKIKRIESLQAVAKRKLWQRKSILTLSTLPGQDIPESPGTSLYQLNRLTSPYDDLPNDNKTLHLEHHACASDSGDEIIGLRAEMQQNRLESRQKAPIPDFLLDHGRVSKTDISSDPSVWWTRSGTASTQSHEQIVSSETPTAAQEINLRTQIDVLEELNDMNCDEIAEPSESHAGIFCGHPLGFHATQEAIWDCIDTQWDDGKTLLTSSPQSMLSSPQTKVVLARTNSPFNEDGSIIPSPLRLHHSRAQNSHLEPPLTSPFLTASKTPSLDETESSTFTLRAPSVSPISSAASSPTAPIRRRRLERSASTAMLGPPVSPPSDAVPADSRATFPQPSSQTLHSAPSDGPPNVQPMLGLLASSTLPPAPGEVTNTGYLNPMFPDVTSSSQNEAVAQGQDFFITYYDAMAKGTEHGWTLALRNSDLGDKAIADAYLSNLPVSVLTRYVKQESTSEQFKGHSTSQTNKVSTVGPTVYSFGTSMTPGGASTQRGSLGGRANLSPPRRTVLQGHELRELELLSTIREERESQASLLASSNTVISTAPPQTPQASPGHGSIQTPPQTPSQAPTNKTPSYETTQCDPCRSNRSRNSKHHKPTKCDKLLPSCTQCITSNTQCSYRGNTSNFPQPTQLSMAHRQRLLVHILATAGSIDQPEQQIYQRYRARDAPDTTNDMLLPLGRALDAVVETIRSLRDIVAHEITDSNNVPVHPDGVADYYGALALVLAAVWALERATTAAETEGGTMLALKTSSNPAHVEFVNRVFEVLAVFRAKGSGDAEGVTVHVLDACVVQVDDALWRLWEQMEGGLDENGRPMGEDVHWDIMVEVAREVLGRGFVDASRLSEVRRALDKVANMKWMR